MKTGTEAEFGAALRDVELVTYVYRLPDPKGGEGVSNWKPCDFMSWRRTQYLHGSVAESAWFECKDTNAVEAFPFRDIRPAQWAGMREAKRLGIPYWLAVWWRRHKRWTISDTSLLLASLDLYKGETPTSVDRRSLIELGIDSTKEQLGSTLKQLLLGELD